jgi:uncharacterized LabA/DUF88 family protein
MGIRVPSDPHLQRWMVFVDGENFAIRGRAVADEHKVVLERGALYRPDVFLWYPTSASGPALATRERKTERTLPGEDPRQFCTGGERLRLQHWAKRAYYYTSLTGSDEQVNEIRAALVHIGFAPAVFKKPKDQARSKGVDVSLTKDMLSHAFMDNYDVAVLVSGDGDFAPVVDEVKRLGKLVYVAFFVGKSAGLSPALKVAADEFIEMDGTFLDTWRRWDAANRRAAQLGRPWGGAPRK